ncbi:MAG: rRNA maturation RNase YbeY [Gallionellaceae bacterium]|jgi:probable rRNA maturation factor
MSHPCRLSLVVQYASKASNMPTRQQLRRWVGVAMQQDLHCTIRIVDEIEGRKLNLDYRGKDYATNVLTFVYDDSLPLSGDIVFCAPVVEREAAAQGKQTVAHYAHLAVHGILHLQGYDHEKNADAREMEALETALMAKLRYPAPYAVTNEV